MNENPSGKRSEMCETGGKRLYPPTTRRIAEEAAKCHIIKKIIA
jgi:hypothetical protein